MRKVFYKGVPFLLSLSMLLTSASPVHAASTDGITTETVAESTAETVAVTSDGYGEGMDDWDESNAEIDQSIQDGDYDNETDAVSDDKDVYVGEAEEEPDSDTGSSDFVYLSDLEYMSNSTQGWSGHSIMKDMNYSNGNISLMVNGEKVYFPKGIEAHANSNVYYDLGEGHEYTRFLAYAGIDTSVNAGDGVQMWVYGSNDLSKAWTGLWTKDNRYHVYKGGEDAVYMDVDISGYRYIRLQAYQISNNTADHATWADAKLVKAGYSEEFVNVPDISELDEKIKANNDTSSDEYQMLVLQRTLIKNIGQMTLKKTMQSNDYVRQAYEWLMSDEANLEAYVMGGAPSGTYVKSLEVMGRLLEQYGSDLSDPVYGQTYKTMLIALSLTHSTTVRFWISDTVGTNDDGSDTSGTNSKNVSDPVKRYQVYKGMMAAGKLHSMFYTLTVEEMRLVMNSKISDSEIEWFRDYSYSRSSNKYLNYSDWWITYKNQAYRWHDDMYYDASTIADYSAKYGNFLDYGVTVEKYNPSIWMIYDSWGICWHISNTGANLVQTQGVPALTLGQPSHVCYTYFEDSGSGETKSVGRYFASNWNQTNFTTYTGDRGYYVNRPYMNWGVGSYTQTTTYNASYVWLSQKALDHYEDFTESQKLVLAAEIYAENPDKQAELYEQAIEKCQYNFNAYLNLVYLYRDNADLVTDAQRYELACSIVENLGENPLPVNDLWLLLNEQISDNMVKMRMSILRSNAVAAWTASSSSDVRNVASIISGVTAKKAIATFSLDGDDAGKIVLSEDYQSLGINWNYSLNGGKDWSDPTDAVKVALSQDEIDSLTTDGIKIHLMGTDVTNPANWFTIALTKASLSSGLYANDLENQVIGATNGMEWSYEDSDDWSDYDTERTKFTGNVTIRLRTKATGTVLPSASRTFSFTEDTDTDSRKYVSIRKLTVDSYSSAYVSDPASNLINGNINNMWHTLWNGSDTERWIVVKVDEPIYLSAVDYVPRQSGSNGRAKDAVLYTSLDGEEWTEAATVTGWANTAATKTIDLERPVKVQYVKFQITTGYGGSYGSAAMLNLFEDTTGRGVKDAALEAGFSFDGDDANVLSVSSEDDFDTWQYSLDGGKTWSNDMKKLSVTLSDSEIAEITADKDILVRASDSKNITTLDITKGTLDTSNLYRNDLENRIMGVTDDMEWTQVGIYGDGSYVADGKWTSFAEENPRWDGDEIIQIRKSATGTVLASDAKEYRFWVDVHPAERMYIPIENITVESASSNAKSAVNMNDGYASSNWYTTSGDKEKSIVYKLDKARYISGVGYLGFCVGTSRFKNVSVYTSMDGKTWTKAADAICKNSNDYQMQVADMEPTKALYVKFKVNSTYGSPRAAATMLYLFEDTTITE